MTVTVRPPIIQPLPRKRLLAADVWPNLLVTTLAVLAPAANVYDSLPRKRPTADFQQQNFIVRAVPAFEICNIYDGAPPPRRRVADAIVQSSAYPAPAAISNFYDGPAPKRRLVLDAIQTVLYPAPPAIANAYDGPAPKQRFVMDAAQPVPYPDPPSISNIYDGATRKRTAVETLYPNLVVLIPALSPAPPPGQYYWEPPPRRRLQSGEAPSMATLPTASPIVPTVPDALPGKRWRDPGTAQGPLAAPAPGAPNVYDGWHARLKLLPDTAGATAYQVTAAAPASNVWNDPPPRKRFALDAPQTVVYPPAPVVNYWYERAPVKRLPSDAAHSFVYPAASVIPASFDAPARRRLPSDVLYPNLAVQASVLQPAPAMNFQLDAPPARRPAFDALAPNLAVLHSLSLKPDPNFEVFMPARSFKVSIPDRAFLAVMPYRLFTVRWKVIL